MEIILKGTAKELADFAVEMQNRLAEQTNSNGVVSEQMREEPFRFRYSSTKEEIAQAIKAMKTGAVKPQINCRCTPAKVFGPYEAKKTSR